MSRPTLLLVPGLLCTAALWRSQAAALADDHDVRIADHGSADTVEAIAEAVLAQAPARFSLAGLSMGGYVAFEIVRRAPERVERLALLDTRSEADGAEAAENRRRQIAIAQAGGFSRIPDLQLPKMFAPARAEDPKLVGLFRAMAVETGAAAFVRQQTAILRRPDSRPLLPRIGVPTLVLVGAEDQLTPPETMRPIAEAIPNAHFEVVAGAGHLSPLEAPEAVTRAFATWLARPAAGVERSPA
jgi:pimeloyl-ACP methyl ester carboxylesterase